MRPPIERIAHDVGPTVCGFDHTIDIDLVRPPGRGDGVLVAQGSRYSGWVIYIAGGKLIYETSMVPWVERIVSADPLPEGKLQAELHAEDDRAAVRGRRRDISSTASKVSERKFDRCILSPSYDGLSVGADLGGQVSVAYHGTNPFQGQIERVQISIDNRNFSTLETMHFLREMMFRQ